MLFISHKTEDKAIANELLRRVLERGYSDKQVFLDSDPGSGIEAGAAWERKIYESLKHTRAMIVLCSTNWLKSQWCFVELGYAKAMAISVFPIIIEKCDVGSTLSSTQAIDLTNAREAVAREAAFERLWTSLEEQHLGPKDNLPWPPSGEKDNCPFPGLMYFDEKHAPVFFGREQERDTVIKQLKAMRNSGVPRLLMIVGGSGSGKSSLLRAGVLPWLRHPTEQRDWLVLPTLRYGETPNDDVTLLERLAEVIASCYPQNHPQRPNWKALRDKFEADDVEQATRDFVEATVDLCQAKHQAGAQPVAGSDQPQTTLLVIDQFEELLTAAAGPSAQKFLKFLRTLLSRSNGRLLVIGTMRSDYLDTFEQHAESLKPPFLELYRLPPFPWERVTEVIVKPAERVDVTFTEELISRLKGDAPTSDALPLLAFTLEKLFRQCAGDKLIELREYEQLGGMTGAITQAVMRILPKDLPNETEQALRRSFVNHLAQVNEKDEFARRRAHWETLPAAARPLLEEFVRRERLLHRSGKKGELVEVTHEAIFRCWDQLKKWLQDDLPALRLRRRVETLAEEWEGSCSAANPKGDAGLLLTRAQLAALDEWLQQAEIVLPDQEMIFVQESREKLKSDEQRELEQARQFAEAQAARAAAEAARAKEAERNQRLAESAQQQAEKHAIVEKAAAQRQRRITWWAFGAASVAAVAFGIAVFAKLAADRANTDTKVEIDKRLKIATTLAAEKERLAEAEAKRASDAQSFSSQQLALRKDAEKRLAENYVIQADNLARDGRLKDALDTYARASDIYEQTQSSPIPLHLSLLLLHRNTPQHLNRWPLNHNSGSATFSPDGRLFAAISNNENDTLLGEKDPPKSTIEVRSLATGHQVWAFPESTHLTQVAFSPSGKLIASVRRGPEAEEVVVRDAADGREIAAMRGHSKQITCIAFSPNGERLATGSSDTTIKVWDVTNNLEVRVLSGHAYGVTDVVFSPNGKWCVSASGDNAIRLWDVETGEKIKQFDHHDSWLRAVRFSPDGKYLASGGTDSLKLWSVETGLQLKSFPAGAVYALAFIQDGRFLVSSGGDVSLWDVESGKRVESFRLEEMRSRGYGAGTIDVSPDGKLLMVHVPYAVDLWSIPPANEVIIAKGHRQKLNSVVVSKSGALALTSSDDGTMRLWDTATGLALKTFFGLPAGFTSDFQPADIAFTPDERHVVANVQSHQYAWDAATGHRVTLEEFTKEYCGKPMDVTMFIRGGRFAVLTDADIARHIWDLERRSPVLTYKRKAQMKVDKEFSFEKWNNDWEMDSKVYGDILRICAVSPDGQRAVIWAEDKIIWNLATGERRSIAPGRSWSILGTFVTFSPDAKYVLTAQVYDLDGTPIELWDSQTGELVRTFHESKGAGSVQFVADGRYILTSNAGGSSEMKLWDVETGREVHSIAGDGFAALSANGRVLVAGGYSEGTELHIYDFDRIDRYRHFEKQLGTSPKGRTGLLHSSDPVAVGDWYAFQGRPDWALDLFSSTSESSVSPTLKGRCRWKVGDFAGARRDFERANEIREIGDSYYSLLQSGVRTAQASAEFLSATDSFNSGDLSSAVNECDSVIELDSELVDAYLLRARVQKQLGNVGGALSDIARVLERNPPRDGFDKEVMEFKDRSKRPMFPYRNDVAAEAHLLRAMILDNLGEPDEAVEEYARASLLGGQSRRDEFVRTAADAMKRKDYQSAIDDYTIAIKMRAGENTLREWVSLMGRAEGRRQIGDEVGAEADFRAAVNYIVAHFPHPEKFLSIVRFLGRRASVLDAGESRDKDINEACDYVERLLDFESLREDWKQLNLEDDEDLASLRTSVRFKAVIHVFTSYEFARLKEFEKAEDEATVAITQCPKCARAFLARGFIRKRRGTVAGSIEDYQKVVELDSKQQEANYQLACHYSWQSMGQRDNEEGQKRSRELLTSALKHLEAAIAGGFTQRKRMMDDEELGPVRRDARFAELVLRIPAEL